MASNKTAKGHTQARRHHKDDDIKRPSTATSDYQKAVSKRQGILSEERVEEDDEDDDKKCPPQRVPSLNPNDEWGASHKPEEQTSATRFKDDPCEPSMKLYEDNNEAKIHNHKGQHKMQSSTKSSERHEGQRTFTPRHEADAIEEAVLFDKTAEMKDGADEHVLASSVYQLSASAEDRNTAHDTLHGRDMVAKASRGPDYSLGSEPVDIQGRYGPNAAENRRRWDEAFSSSRPGAFREGDHDIEEGYTEDAFTVSVEEDNEEQAPAVTREKSIKPISANLVNEEEEDRRLQEKINQAVERERQQAVIAEVVPAGDGDLAERNAHRFGTRRRYWFVIGAFLLLVVTIAILLVLILTGVSKSPPEPGPYPNCKVAYRAYIGNGYCDGDDYNTTECGWDGGDCIPCDNGFFGSNCTLDFPNCTVPNPKYIGNDYCDDERYNRSECGWDGGDCAQPDCTVPFPEWIGDGNCDGDEYNTTECGWDGGDCLRLPCDAGYFGPNCTYSYPNCTVPNPKYIGNGYCDGDEYYNTTECGWDGGDCLPCDDGYFGLYCLLNYTNCLVPNPKYIGNGNCDGGDYNTTECGWDGGDCVAASSKRQRSGESARRLADKSKNSKMRPAYKTKKQKKRASWPTKYIISRETTGSVLIKLSHSYERLITGTSRAAASLMFVLPIRMPHPINHSRDPRSHQSPWNRGKMKIP
jgi:hypothetical protein